MTFHEIHIENDPVYNHPSLWIVLAEPEGWGYGKVLGTIRWCRYSWAFLFCPEGTVNYLDQATLREVADFCEAETKKHKERSKVGLLEA